jgi:nucleoside 2-deoxyribosyltransferase
MKSRMKLIYVAGPYRSENRARKRDNIANAKQAAIKLWKMGCAVICPHANTWFVEGHVSDETILEGDRVMLQQCDAVLGLPGHEQSEGTTLELGLATDLGIPVFLDIDELKEWLAAQGEYVTQVAVG